MKFDKDVLVDMTYGATEEGFEIVDKILLDTSRWSVHYRQVFKYKGRYYETYYSVGATESQDESPYEYEGDQIECREVVPVQKTITAYEKV